MSANDKGVSVPSANAWSRPLQQRNHSSNSDPLCPPPGLGPQPNRGDSVRTDEKELGEQSVSPSSVSDHQSALRDRFLQLSLAMVGQRVAITRTDGAIIEGIFHTFTPFAPQPPDMRNMYVVKSCRLVAEGSKKRSMGVSHEAVADGSTIIIRTEGVSSIHVKGMRLDTSSHNTGTAQNEQNSSWRHSGVEVLRTDAEISVGKDVREHGLVAAGRAWTSDGKSPSSSRTDKLIGLLEESGATRPRTLGTSLRSNIGEWDQFKANEDLFDVRATFDENLYTTELDKSQINRMEIQKAERLAREIESTTSSNIHIAEERGHVVQGDYDEEDKYSGVLARDKKGIPRPTIVENNESKAVDIKDGNSKVIASEKHEPQSVMPVRMNYAAAAKADTTAAKALPPGFGVEKGTTSTSSVVSESTTDTERRSNDEGCGTAAFPNSSERREKLVNSLGKERGRKASDGSFDSEEVKPETNVTSSGCQVEKKEPESDRKDGKASVGKALSPDPGIADGLELPEDTEERSATAELHEKKVKSKLNANAKEFTFNPHAKSFTPGSGVGEGGSSASSVQDSFVPPMGVAGSQPLQAQHPHFVQLPAQVTQAGMMSMMNARFGPTMRFQGAPPYQGMDQHTPPLQPQPSQQVPSTQGQDGGSSTLAQSEDPATQQQSQPSQQQRLPMQYVAPVGTSAYLGGSVPLQRGPGTPHLGGYHQQLVSGPQQMPVVQGKTAYHHRFSTPGHLQQSGGLPNVAQMHVTSGSQPYYVAGNIHYPSGSYMGHGAIDEILEPDHRSGGRGGGHRHGRKNVRGRGGTGQQNNHHNRQQTTQISSAEKNTLLPADDGPEPEIGDANSGEDGIEA